MSQEAEEAKPRPLDKNGFRVFGVRASKREVFVSCERCHGSGARTIWSEEDNEAIWQVCPDCCGNKRVVQVEPR